MTTVQPDEPPPPPLRVHPRTRLQRGLAAQQHSLELLDDVRGLLARSADRCRRSRDALESSHRATSAYGGHPEAHS